MKTQSLFLILAAFLMHEAVAQQTLNETFTHNSITRNYTLYVPASYTGADAVPLIFCFHGYTSNGPWILIKSGLKPVADTAGFIIVCPQALENTVGSTSWNLGNLPGSDNDVDFVDSLYHALRTSYSIDTNRVYSTGFSQGGFMSYILALQKSAIFTAIAPVSGCMLYETLWERSPIHPTPVIHFHGTNDPAVAYNGNVYGQYLSVEASIGYWVNYNHCSTEPEIIQVPNLSTDDHSTVEHIIYSGCHGGAQVELFKITGGLHYWPGFEQEPGNMDIQAAAEIWKFFSRYRLSDLKPTFLEPAEISENIDESVVLPNPASSGIRIENSFNSSTSYPMYSCVGNLVKPGCFDQCNNTIAFSELAAGINALRIDGMLYKQVKNLVVSCT